MLIDLTQTLYEGMQVFPGSLELKIETVTDHEPDGWHEHMLHIPNHTGTHIDAPYHYYKDGKRINDFPLEKFIGTGIVLDFTDKKSLETIAEKDLTKYEEKIEKADIAILRTGWEKYYGTKEYENHPYLSEDGADYLTNFHLKAVGTDAFSPDSTVLFTEHAHRILLGREILLLENLRNLDRLEAEKEYHFSFFPLPTSDTDGSPVRAVCYL